MNQTENPLFRSQVSFQNGLPFRHFGFRILVRTTALTVTSDLYNHGCHIFLPFKFIHFHIYFIISTLCSETGY